MRCRVVVVVAVLKVERQRERKSGRESDPRKDTRFDYAVTSVD